MLIFIHKNYYRALFIFDFVFKVRLLICYFFFSLLLARKKRKRSNPEKEKSRARLEFVGILKQELKNFAIILTSKFYNSMPKIRSLSGSQSPKGRYKKCAFINFLKFVPQTVTLGCGIVQDFRRICYFSQKFKKIRYTLFRSDVFCFL